MLHFVGFRKSYGEIPVLIVHDLRIGPGIYWVRGANGSGKSTFLKTAAGILSFYGDIVLNGRTSVKKHAVHYRKGVNFAEAEPVFPEFLTGREMIAMFALAKDAPRRQEEYFIESMRMQAYISEPLRTYSTGMLKKLSLVLAFLGRPEVILLDEPLITIDAGSLNILYAWIAERNKQEGTSFLLSSHQGFESGVLAAPKVICVESNTVTVL